MLKVLHIVLGLEIGGLEKFVLDLVRDSREVVAPHILCLQKKGELGECVAEVPVWELGKPEGFRLGIVADIVKVLRKNRVDIIHTHNPAPHFYGALAGLCAGVPVVHTKHGRNYPGSRKKVLLNHLATALTSRVVPVSHEAADVCRSIEKISQRKIHPIWNGVDVRRYAPGDGRKRLSRTFGVRAEDLLVGIVARLSPEKNHSCLLRAFAELRKDVPCSRLLVVGDGILREQLESEAASLGIAPQVLFVGARHDVPDLLRECDAFALSSKTEGLPLTVLEAMACGLPVVATDVGGNSEAVRHGETGFLVESDDHFALAHRLKALLLDPDLRKKMGAAGRHRVQSSFDCRETARQYVELYQSVVGPEK